MMGCGWNRRRDALLKKTNKKTKKKEFAGANGAALFPGDARGAFYSGGRTGTNPVRKCPQWARSEP